MKWDIRILLTSSSTPKVCLHGCEFRIRKRCAAGCFTTQKLGRGLLCKDMFFCAPLGDAALFCSDPDLVAWPRTIDDVHRRMTALNGRKSDGCEPSLALFFSGPLICAGWVKLGRAFSNFSMPLPSPVMKEYLLIEKLTFPVFSHEGCTPAPQSPHMCNGAPGWMEFGQLFFAPMIFPLDLATRIVTSTPFPLSEGRKYLTQIFPSDVWQTSLSNFSRRLSRLTEEGKLGRPFSNIIERRCTLLMFASTPKSGRSISLLKPGRSAAASLVNAVSTSTRPDALLRQLSQAPIITAMMRQQNLGQVSMNENSHLYRTRTMPYI